MNNERWKEIPGYEGLYEVSTSGQVRSIRDGKNTHNGLILSPRLRPNGYRQFRLSKNGKPATVKASRLVALTFLPNPENKPTVNHKNGIKNDDCLENLEWATFSENTKHAFDTGLAKPKLGEKQRSCRLKENQVMTAKRLLNLGYHFRDIATMYNVSPTTIADIKHGRTWGWLLNQRFNYQ